MDIFPFEFGWMPYDPQYQSVRRLRYVAQLARGGEDLSPFRVFGETTEDTDWATEYVVPALRKILTYVPPPLSDQIDVMVNGYQLVPPGIATTYNSSEEYRKWQGISIDRTSFYDGDKLVPLAEEFADQALHFMPVYETGGINQLEYILLHEYGHTVAQPLLEGARAISSRDGLLGALGLPTHERGMPEPAVAELSDYGKLLRGEAWAEAFAEWYGTRGNTDNLAAKWYAETFGWAS